MPRRLVLAAVSLACAAPALALDMPARKAGLWELKMAFEGRRLPAQVMQQCIDAATDRLMNANFGGPAQGHCSQQNVQNLGGTMVVDSVCQYGPAKTTSHAVITGSFDSAYTVDVTTSREGAPAPGMAPAGSTHMTMEAKWLGPCAAGQRPGDVITAGHKFNMIELQKMQQLRGPPRQP